MEKVLGGLLLGIFLIAYVVKPYITQMLPTLTIWGTGYEVAIWALMPVLLLILLVPLAIYALRKRRNPPNGRF